MHRNRLGLAAGLLTFSVGTSPANRARRPADEPATEDPSPALLHPLNPTDFLLNPPRPGD